MLRIAECCDCTFNKMIIKRYRIDYEDPATEKLKLLSKRDLRQLKECLRLKFKGDPTLFRKPFLSFKFFWASYAPNTPHVFTCTSISWAWLGHSWYFTHFTNVIFIQVILLILIFIPSLLTSSITVDSFYPQLFDNYE